MLCISFIFKHAFPLGRVTGEKALGGLAICCCNLSGSVALIVWFTTNGMCAKNNTIIYVRQASNSKRDCPGADSLGGAEKSQKCLNFFLYYNILQYIYSQKTLGTNTGTPCSLLQYIYSQKTLGTNMGTPNFFLFQGAIWPRYVPVSHHEVIAKIPSLTFAPELIFLQWLPNIHYHR